MRKCADCPESVRVVCIHVFGKFWEEKSRNYTGCDEPMDGVAEAWYARGWEPGTGATISLTLPLKDVPKMPTRPRRPTASKIQSGMPTGPRVSAAIMRQADLFFGRAKK